MIVLCPAALLGRMRSPLRQMCSPVTLRLAICSRRCWSSDAIAVGSASQSLAYQCMPKLDSVPIIGHQIQLLNFGAV